MSSKIPFSILTGWLGAGKTTALNRILAARHNRRIAVLVNELGRISIDTKLIIGRGGDILELAGGCICCKVDLKDDLWDGIVEIIDRMNPECIVLETTGIAEPDAILDGIAKLPEAIRARLVVAGVTTVVDAEAFPMIAIARSEPTVQVQFANRIMLSKLDRASAAQVTATRSRIFELNPEVEIASFETNDSGDIALCHWMFEVRPAPAALALSLSEKQRARDVFAAAGREFAGMGVVVESCAPDCENPLHGHVAATAHAHHHRAPHAEGQITAITYSDEAPLVASSVLSLLENLGDSLLRAKGLIWCAGETPHLGYLEKAGTHLDIDASLKKHFESAQIETLARSNEFVLIGTFDDAAVMRQLHACRARSVS